MKIENDNLIIENETDFFELRDNNKYSVVNSNVIDENMWWIVTRSVIKDLISGNFYSMDSASSAMNSREWAIGFPMSLKRVYLHEIKVISYKDYP